MGKLHVILGKPGGGGTHFLPDGAVPIVGHVGLRRLFPDGRVALLADGKVKELTPEQATDRLANGDGVND